MLNAIHELSASQLSALYANQEISPVTVLKGLYQHIDSLNPILNCFSILDFNSAMLEAQASEKRWQQGQPLSSIDGVPTTIKDSFEVVGWPTCFGSKTVDPNQTWDTDAPVTQLLRQAGVVLLGKTTMPEYGWKGVTDSAVTGITRNPWNLQKTPGGSSGGAASGLASGMFPLAVGSDGGGSIRIPASFCGVFGMKPSVGLVPMLPPSTLGSFVHGGPMAREVKDAALLLNIIAKYWPSDCYSVASPESDYTVDLEQGIAGLKIGFCPNMSHYEVDPEVAAKIEEAAHCFKRLGAEVDIVQPDVDDYLPCFNVHWLVCMRHHYLTLTPEQRQVMDPNYVELAHYAEAIGLYDFYEAQLQRRLLIGQVKELFIHYDLLLMPTEPCVAFEVGKDSPNPKKGEIDSWTPFTCLFNLTGHPAASISAGFSTSGLPIGVQLVAPYYQDKRILQACYAFEQSNPTPMPQVDAIIAQSGDVF